MHLFHDEVREYYKLDEFYSKNDKELKWLTDDEESNEISVEGSRKIRTELSKKEFLKELFGNDYTSDNNKINIEDLKLMHKGKVKSIYAHPEDEDLIIQYYSDDVTAFNKDRYHFDGKGSVNCAISTKIMEYLNDCGVKTHFKECLDDGVTQVCTALKILPLEVTVRNYAFGGVLKRSQHLQVHLFLFYIHTHTHTHIPTHIPPPPTGPPGRPARLRPAPPAAAPAAPPP